MNEYENKINLGQFRAALKNEDYETARKMLDGKYADLFEEYKKVSIEMSKLNIQARSPEELEKLSSDKTGLEAVACLLELIINDGIMLTNIITKQAEGRKK